MRQFIFFVILLLYGLSSIAQPVRKGVQTKKDTTSISIQELLNPSLLPLNINDPAYSSSKSNVTQFSKTTKLLLKLGADLVRGDMEDHSIYSLDNAWKYPGPTVRYPETATEYQLFLDRYRQYNLDNDN
ncbi:hypothetical protein [Fodinibius halophilus]|uniref:Uncharacterized protein n=1 Tax=Fodinibius halophilus TaxID=1736908 RepID=A0A6M1T353_9BACT|nr:hypothetical protein [Fodinibius halophilus]NGP88497.1 hypothetical protein [Fodinibius halophilus]